MHISIRNIRDNEIEKVRNLCAEIWSGYNLPEHRWSIDDMHRCFPIIGAFYSDNLIAALCAIHMESNFYWVHFLCVIKEYRKMHIGTKLMEKLESKIL